MYNTTILQTLQTVMITKHHEKITGELITTTTFYDYMFTL